MRSAALAPVALAILLSGCAGRTPPPGPVQIQTIKEIREVQRPCPVTVPARPAPLPATEDLPRDAVKLAATLALKLMEWAGPGGYGDRADAMLRICTSPAPEPAPQALPPPQSGPTPQATPTP